MALSQNGRVPAEEQRASSRELVREKFGERERDGPLGVGAIVALLRRLRIGLQVARLVTAVAAARLTERRIVVCPRFGGDHRSGSLQVRLAGDGLVAAVGFRFRRV